MFEVTGSKFSDQVFNAFDKAAKIAIALYVFPLTFLALLQVLASGIIISYVYLPIGFLFFIIHLNVAREKYYFNILDMYNDNRTFRSVQRIIFYFVLAFALSIYLIAYIDPNLRSVIEEFAYVLDTSGEIMFYYSGLFMIAISISILDKLLDEKGLRKLRTILLVPILIGGYFGLGLLYKQAWSKDIGLLLLGPVNLLIAKMLFSKPKKEENLIKW